MKLLQRNFPADLVKSAKLVIISTEKTEHELEQSLLAAELLDNKDKK